MENLDFKKGEKKKVPREIYIELTRIRWFE